MTPKFQVSIASPQVEAAAPRTLDPAVQAEPEATATRRLKVIRGRDALFRRALGVADASAIGVTLIVTGAFLDNHNLTWATLAVPPLFVLACKAMGLYERDEHLLHKTTLDEVPALFGITTLVALLLYLSDGLLVDGPLSRAQIFEGWVLLLFLMICFRALARWGARQVVPPERCLVVGDRGAAAKLREDFALSRSVHAELVDVVPINCGGSRDGETLDLSPSLEPALTRHEIDRVILTTGPDLRRDDLLYIIREMKAYGVKVSVFPEASRVAGSSVEVDQLPGLTLLGVRKFEFSRSSRAVKRGFDVIGASIILASLSPLLLAIAIAIKIDSPGAVLFRQQRVGRHGKRFVMLKFRSMVNEAEQRKETLRHLNEGKPGLFKITNDPRVTRVGHWLRRWQLDELPQLFNVLRGEMSLVGPRPLIAEEDELIHGWYRRRLDVPPGITGHWQILGSSSRIPLQEMVKLDNLYVANWSLWGDIRLLLRTIPFVFSRRGV